MSAARSFVFSRTMPSFQVLSHSFSTRPQPPLVSPQMLAQQSEVLLYDAAYSLARVDRVAKIHREYGKTPSLNVDLHLYPDFRARVEEEVGPPTLEDAASIVTFQQGVTGIATARGMQDGFFLDPAPLAFTMSKFIQPMQDIFEGIPRANWELRLRQAPPYMPGISAGFLGTRVHIMEDFDYALRLQIAQQPSICILPQDWGNSYAVVGPAAQLTNSILSTITPFTTFTLLECPLTQYAVFKARNRPYKRYLKCRAENDFFLPEGLDEYVDILTPTQSVIDASAAALLRESSHISGIKHQAFLDYEKDHGKLK